MDPLRTFESSHLIQVKGDLLHSGADYIVHQTNCVANDGKAWGIASSIFKKWPYANIYNGKHTNRRPGTTELMPPPGTVTNSPIVANLMGQSNVGRVLPDESADQRAEWFKQGLDDFLNQLRNSDAMKLTKRRRLESSSEGSEAPGGSRVGADERVVKIGFPHGIGCNLAGGDWQVYESMLENFARQCHLEFGERCQIYVYKKEFYHDHRAWLKRFHQSGFDWLRNQRNLRRGIQEATIDAICSEAYVIKKNKMLQRFEWMALERMGGICASALAGVAIWRRSHAHV